MRQTITILLLTLSTTLSTTPSLEIPIKEPSPEKEIVEYDLLEVLILAKLINSEALSESLEGKIAVGNVVTNRARRKGKSIRQVILRRGQFDGVGTRWYNTWPEPESIEAAKIALTKQLIPEKVEFYHNPTTSTDRGWVRYISKYKYKQIGNHLFCFNPKI